MREPFNFIRRFFTKSELPELPLRQNDRIADTRINETLNMDYLLEKAKFFDDKSDDEKEETKNVLKSLARLVLEVEGMKMRLILANFKRRV